MDKMIFTSHTLAFYLGICCATALVTQITDHFFNRRKSVPTQLIAYLAAFGLLLLLHAFSSDLHFSSVLLSVFHALLIGGATSGTVSATRRLKGY